MGNSTTRFKGIGKFEVSHSYQSSGVPSPNKNCSNWPPSGRLQSVASSAMTVFVAVKTTPSFAMRRAGHLLGNIKRRPGGIHHGLHLVTFSTGADSRKDEAHVSRNSRMIGSGV